MVLRRQAGMAPEPRRRLSVGECTDRTEASCQFSRKRGARRDGAYTDQVECVGLESISKCIQGNGEEFRGYLISGIRVKLLF